MIYLSRFSGYLVHPLWLCKGKVNVLGNINGRIESEIRIKLELSCSNKHTCKIFSTMPVESQLYKKKKPTADSRA